LYSLIQVSSKEGMQTLNQALSALISCGTISEDQAFVISNMQEELKTMRHSYHCT
jgi:Tfp pilus assembly pilus retraction ATPase PilT